MRFDRRIIVFAVPMVVLLALPLLGLLGGLSPHRMSEAWSHPLWAPALWLSIKTSLISLALVVTLGTPFAWWLAQDQRSVAWQWLVDVPMVLPPAVVGLALLVVFGRQGILGSLSGLVFSTAAVVLAQTIVAAPFYISAAVAALRAVDEDVILVARSLGKSSLGAFVSVVLPYAWPGLAAGMGMAWARAVGEFGATLFVAGNLPGVSQTMPLAIYTVMESDLSVALSLSVLLAGLALLALLTLRWSAGRGRRS